MGVFGGGSGSLLTGGEEGMRLRDGTRVGDSVMGETGEWGVGILLGEGTEEGLGSGRCLETVGEETEEIYAMESVAWADAGKEPGD